MKPNKRKRKSIVQPIHAESDASSAIHDPIRAVTKDGATTLAYALNASCTMREAAALKVDLLSLLDSDKEVVLDVSSVERIDTSALQLLCAFMRDRRSRRFATRWSGEQPAFSNAVQILGLGQALSYSIDALA